MSEKFVSDLTEKYAPCIKRNLYAELDSYASCNGPSGHCNEGLKKGPFRGVFSMVNSITATQFTGSGRAIQQD